MRKFTFLLIATILMMSLCVSANATDALTVSGTATAEIVTVGGVAAANSSVAVRIFRHDDHLSNGSFSLSAANTALENAVYLRSVLVYANETVANSDGTYSFSVNIKNLLDNTGQVREEAISERYVAVVSDNRGNEAQTVFLYVDSGEMATDYITLYGMKNDSKENVINFLKGHKYALGIYTPIIEQMNIIPVYDKFYTYLQSVEFNVANPSDPQLNADANAKAMNDMQKLIMIEALNQGKVSTIADYEKELGISGHSAYDYYHFDEEDENDPAYIVDSDFKTGVTDRLSGKGLADIPAFEAAFRDAMILEYVKKADGLDGMKAIIEAYRTEIWPDVEDGISDGAYRSVMGKNYETTALLKSAITSYTPPAGAGGNDGGNDDGGSGGSGGIKKPYNNVGLPNADTTIDVKPLNNIFNDLEPAHWAAEAIGYMADKGYISGRGDGSFGPNDDITRAEFVKIIVGAFELKGTADAMNFDDVKSDSWYREFVGIAFKNGIARGQSETYFGANEKITRQDMAVMLYNAAKNIKGMVPSERINGFEDSDSIAPYACEAVYTLYDAKVIKGYGDGLFGPTALATRAQAVQMIFGLIAQ